MEKNKPKHVTFEQAKWLKEKGFNEPCIAFYDEEDISNEINYYCNANRNVTGGISCWHNDLLSVTNSELDELGVFCYKDEEETESYDRITAPEQWQVEEWLRVNHGIWVEVRHIKTFGVNRFHIIIWKYGEEDYHTIHCGNGVGYEVWDTPQEAYSAAFDYIRSEKLI